ncbi:22730_t:CDS:2, partial [Racocetra persica]
VHDQLIESIFNSENQKIQILGIEFKDPEILKAQEEVDNFTKLFKLKEEEDKKGKKKKSKSLTSSNEQAKSNKILQQEEESKDLKLVLRIQQLKQRLNNMEKHYKYVSQLSEEQTDEHLKEIEKITKAKLHKAKKAKTRKEYLYQAIQALTETNNAILWKNRDIVDEIEEAYATDLGPTLNINIEDFNQLYDYERQPIMQKLLESIEFCHYEPTRIQIQNKYRELLGQQIRTKPKPIIFLPKKPYHDLYKPNDDRPRTPPPKIIIESETTQNWVYEQDKPNIPKYQHQDQAHQAHHQTHQ